MDAAISLRGVTKRFGSHTVLKDLTFDIPRGRTSAVIGPSGTGKSVLLKNIIGLLTPDEGQIYVDGEPIVGIRHKELLRIRRKFGVLFQWTFALLPAGFEALGDAGGLVLGSGGEDIEHTVDDFRVEWSGG